MTRRTPLALFAVLLFLLASLAPALAQPAPEQPTQEEQVEDVEAPPVDPLGRATPRGTLNGFLSAVGERDYERAARYLDLSGMPRAQQGQGPQLARNLETLLDAQGWTLPPREVSDEPQGLALDEFPADTNVVAYLSVRGEDVPVTVRRVFDDAGEQIWLISRDFVRRIPALTREVAAAPIDAVLIGPLQTVRVFGAGVGHWLAMLVLYVVFYFLAGLVIRAAVLLVARLLRWRRPDREDKREVLAKLEAPLRVYLMVWLAGAAAFYLGVSIIVRQIFEPIGATIGWIAVGVFLWRLSDVFVSSLERRLERRERYDMTSILAFARRMLKVLFVALVVMIVLDSYGVNVTAGLAALGIGGIALALGAQRTLENFIGSLSIIADRPIHVGDFCRIGDVTGVVVDIGMRSTRLRTNDQTLVTIPNGFLSSQTIENFARRDRFLLNRRLTLRLDATSDQIRDFVERLARIVAAQEKVVHEPPNVRFVGFSEMGYDVEIWAFVKTQDFTEFLAVQSAVTYGAIDAARDVGVYFTARPQTIMPARNGEA